MDRKKYRDGNIVTVKQNNGAECEMVILKCHRDYATATMLRDNMPYENGFTLVLNGENAYIDAGRTGYVFYDRISSVEGFLPLETLDEIREKIAEATGLRIDVIKKTEENKPEAASMSVGEELEFRRIKEELIAVRTERNIYKELYQKERGWRNETEASVD